KIMNAASFRDYAILYRGNHQSKLLEMRLQELQIPYKLSGGTSFFAKSEIKDLMAYFRLLINPDDDAAFLRIINTPRREIGAATLEKLADYASGRGVSLFSACTDMGLQTLMQKASLKRLEMFHDMIHEAQVKIEETPMQAIRQLVDDIDYEAWLQEQSSSSKAAQFRIDNVQYLLNNIDTMLKRDEDND